MIKCLTFCLAFRRPRFLVCEYFIGDEAFLFFPLGSASEVKVWIVGILKFSHFAATDIYNNTVYITNYSKTKRVNT